MAGLLRAPDLWPSRLRSDRNVGMMSSYKEILQLTEKIEHLLGTDDYENLRLLIKEREEAFSNLQEEPQGDTAVVIGQILECEKKCVSLAMEKKKKIQADLKEMPNRKRLHQAYGQHML